MSRNAQTWKFRRTLLHNEEPCRAQTLQNLKFLEGLTYDKSRTSQRLIIFLFWKMMTSHENQELQASSSPITRITNMTYFVIPAADCLAATYSWLRSRLPLISWK